MVKDLTNTINDKGIYIIEKVSPAHSGPRYRCQCPVCKRTDWIVRGSRLKNTSKEQVSMCKNCSAKNNLQKIKIPFYKDITNQRFGKLTVLEKTNQKNNSTFIWKCKCDCGNICYIDGEYLRNGDTTSCGCLKQSKGEEKIINILQYNNIPFEKEKIFKNFKYKDTNRYPRFDFYVNNKYIIEYDGKQHFKKDTGYGRDLIEIKEKDKIKNEYCFKHNIPIIRIPYTKYNSLCLNDLLLETSQYVVKEGENE